MNNCTNCSLCQTRFNQVQPVGNCTFEECELLLVSDYPHAEDDTSGYIFTGAQYQFIWDLLSQIGVKYIATSIVKCIPLDISSRRYRKPTTEEYVTCLQSTLIPEIDAIKPKVVFLFGQATVDVLLPGMKTADIRERALDRETQNHKFKVLGSYSPLYVLNSDNEMFYKRLVEDLVYACRHAMAYREEGKYKTVTLDADKFCRVAKIWCDDPTIEYVGFDTESNGLDPLVEGAKITSFSVSVSDDVGYNIFMYHPEKPEITDEQRQAIIDAAKSLLTQKKVVVHHAKHEHRYTKVCWGFTPNITDDTMYMAYILFMSYPGMGYGLKYLSGRFISMPPYEELILRYSELFKKLKRYKSMDEDREQALVEEYKDIEVTVEDLRRFWSIIKDPDYYIKQAESDENDVFYWLVPERIMERYAGIDAIAPLMLHRILKPMIEADSGFMRTYDLMMRSAETFANVELKGMRVVDLERWTKRYQEEIDKTLAEIRSYEEVKLFEAERGAEYNPNSAVQNVDVFFSKFAFPVKGLTGKGEPSTSENNLIAMITEYQAKGDSISEREQYELDFLLKFRRYKKLNKIMSSYFIGLRRFMYTNNAFDGHSCTYMPVPEGSEDTHIRPQYMLHGTETGRLSSQNPSLHTIPTNSEVKMILAPHDYGRGGLFVMADYSQAELRVLSSVVEKYYGDGSMAQAYREGRDLHLFTASKVFNKPEEEVLDAERRFSKTISFSITYGSSEASVAESTGRTPQEVHELFEYYYQSFPGIRLYIEDMHRYATQHGCVRFPSGRIRHLPAARNPDNRGAYSSAMRQAQNAPIQGSSSDIAVEAICKIDEMTREQGLKTRVVGTVHDSIYVDVAPGELFEGMAILKYAMKTYPESTLDYLTCPLGVDLDISTNLGTHATVKGLVENEDGSKILTLKGYDTVLDEVIEEMRVSYDVEEKILESHIHDTGDASLIAKRVISLSLEGKFTEQTRELIVRPKK